MFIHIVVMVLMWVSSTECSLCFCVMIVFLVIQNGELVYFLGFRLVSVRITV